MMTATTSRRGLRLIRSVLCQLVTATPCCNQRTAEHGGAPPNCVSDTGFMFLLLLQLMDAVMLQLTRARNRLTTPASMTLPELATSGLMVQDTRQ